MGLLRRAFPSLTGTVLRSEVEPDDRDSTAVTFASGDALVGTLSSVSDLDSWKVALGAGDALLFWGDSTAAAISAVRLSIVNTNGSDYIASGYSGPAITSFAFRAPAAGTYYLRVAQSIGTPSGSYYRVRTRLGSPQSGEARDLRDVAVAYLGPSSGPVRFVSPRIRPGTTITCPRSALAPTVSIM